MKNTLRAFALLLVCALMFPVAFAEETTGENLPDAILEAIRQEHMEVNVESVIPSDYLSIQLHGGKVEKITFPTYDYFAGGTPIERTAWIYLPPDYNEENQYDLLILCHGIGGNQDEWGMTGSNSKVKHIMDNLILKGEIRPFIIVTPYGKSGITSDYMAFYQFGQTLRNDLLPWLDEHYATYGHGEADLSASRQHRAMAGLSMGGMQTINIGMCECLDLFSWFGAFSAAPTSYSSPQIAARLNAFPEEYSINYMYNICGLQDTTAYASASAAAKNLPLYTGDRITEDNWCWQELNGGHSFNIWYLGFYNFARIFGAPAVPAAE